MNKPECTVILGEAKDLRGSRDLKGEIASPKEESAHNDGWLKAWERPAPPHRMAGRHMARRADDYPNLSHPSPLGRGKEGEGCEKAGAEILLPTSSGSE
jgi:hypothetical protein